MSEFQLKEDANNSENFSTELNKEEHLVFKDSANLAAKLKSANQLEMGTNIEIRLAKIQTIIAKKRNPYLEAGKLLLRFLAEVPILPNIEEENLDQLRLLLIAEFDAFTHLCERCNLRREHILAVRYTLCTAIDEAIGQTVWGGGSKESQVTGPWSTRSLAQFFHEDVQGGSSVFLLIGRLSSNPSEHQDVLEVMLHVLDLDFQGEYRGKTLGQRTLAMIRHQLYSLISSNREPFLRELSPHCVVAKSSQLKNFRNIPVWVTASIFGLLLFSMFAWYKYTLLTKIDEVVENINKISKVSAIQQKSEIDLKTLLESEIKLGLLSVETSGRKSTITFKSDTMFIKRATLSENSKNLLVRIAAELNKVKGQIDVIGYTDNKPISTKEFPDNLSLSKKRAIVVAQILSGSGVDDLRLHTLGMGETSPVAENSTEEGRSKNRRVEIIVTEGDIPSKENSQYSPSANEILKGIEQKKPLNGLDATSEPIPYSNKERKSISNEKFKIDSSVKAKEKNSSQTTIKKDSDNPAITEFSTSTKPKVESSVVVPSKEATSSIKKNEYSSKNQEKGE